MRASDQVRRDMLSPLRQPTLAYSKQIAQVLDYIHKHLCEALPIKILCKVGCMSRANLFRKFKKEVGLTPIEFINRERIRRAAEMLLQTPLTIVDIGYQVGFNSIGYFIRLFKKYMGVTPNRYRLQVAAAS